MRKYRLKWRLFWLAFYIKYYDTIISFQYINFAKPWMKPVIPEEQLSSNAPDKYQELWDDYVTVQQDILEL